MSSMNRALQLLEDWLFGALAFGSIWLALILAAALVSSLLVGVVLICGRPQAVRASRNRFQARTLELLLFRHDVRVLCTACGRILAANAVYISQLFWPALVSALPLTVLWMHALAWFEHRPAGQGHLTVLELQLADEFPVLSTPVEVVRAEGFDNIVGPVRIPACNQLCFRLTTANVNNAEITLRVGTEEYRQLVPIDERLVRLSPVIERDRPWLQLMHPADRPLSVTGPVVRIVTHYPKRTVFVGQWECSASFVGIVLTGALSLLGARMLGLSLF
ncbi:MAG: hypothetical protein JSS49_18055 [Planctomycetes bacterium]|nr:hypothetical protein [Planctomycetota bacterium]